MSRTPSASGPYRVPLAGAVGVPIDDHLQRRLERLAVRTGSTPGQLITEAIDEYLQRSDRARLPSWVGAAGRASEDRVGSRR